MNKKLLQPSTPMRRKFNAFIRFTKEGSTVCDGCINFGLVDVSYHSEYIYGKGDKESLIIQWGNYTTQVYDPKQIELDREFKLVELHQISRR